MWFYTFLPSKGFRVKPKGWLGAVVWWWGECLGLFPPPQAISHCQIQPSLGDGGGGGAELW